MSENVSIGELEKYIGGQVVINGVVENLEDHGGILFLKLNDLSSSTNAVIIPDKEKAFAMAKNLKEGYLVEVAGIVKKCPLSFANFSCEIEVETLSILSARTRVENMIKIAGK